MSARVTLSTGSLYGYSLERIFDLTHQLGLDGVELLLTDELMAAGPTGILELSERSTVAVRSVHFPFMGRRSDADFHEAYERTAIFAASLPQCEAVVVHTPVEPSLHTAVGQGYIQSLRRAQAHLRPTGGRVAIENRGVGRVPERKAYLDDLVNLRRLAEEWDLAMTYDVGHAASWGLDVVRTLDQLGSRVRNIHLSDSHVSNWLRRLPMIHSHFRDHQPLGTGSLPLQPLLAQLAGNGYDGLVTLELSPLSLHLPAPWQWFERLQQSVQRCRAGLATPPTVDQSQPSPRPHRAPSE